MLKPPIQTININVSINKYKNKPGHTHTHMHACVCARTLFLLSQTRTFERIIYNP